MFVSIELTDFHQILAVFIFTILLHNLVSSTIVKYGFLRATTQSDRCVYS